MSAGTLDIASELKRVQVWRHKQLVILGVPAVDAAALAVARDIESWHEAERLISLGCPPELVLEILT